MAVVRNLMIRIGADYSAARRAMQGATRELQNFRRNTERTTNRIQGRRGLGGIAEEMKSLSATVADSFSRLRGVRGIGGVLSELKSLRPALSAATKGFRGVALAAGGASAALGPVGISLAAITAALSVLATGLYQLSQTAARFEADMGRLNITLREGARAYMDWAQAQGLAKQTAAELGATYGNLLASFISDTKQLQESTQDLVHATRVIASYTGRDIDDVFNRIRSGMLGSTEAIEDLGVYVNISMIESTEAFRRFAGDKSWNQLTFQQQQQIRLAAILEQTYKRYGYDLQNNVMTRQERLLEQFKDIRLHLSQAFLPIWDAVLPALTRMAEALADVTEQLARFTYWLRGWDYDEMNRGAQGAERNAEAIEELGESLEETGKQAAKARSELASFDRLNLLGFGTGAGQSGSGRGSGGSGAGVADGGRPSLGGRSPFDIEIPKIPPLRIEFEPPRPPDAGIGAVATAVVSTVNNLVSEVNAKLREMWGSITLQGQLGIATQKAMWDELAGAVTGVTVPSLVLGVQLQWQSMWQKLRELTQIGSLEQKLSWQSMWDFLRAQTLAGVANQVSNWQQMWKALKTEALAGETALRTNWGVMWDSLKVTTYAGASSVKAQFSEMLTSIRQNATTDTSAVWNTWKTFLAGVLADLVSTRPRVAAEWERLKTSIESIKNPISAAREAWSSALSFMSEKLNQHSPVFQKGWSLISSYVSSLIPDLNSVRSAWASALSDMQQNALSRLSVVISKVYEVINAWNSLKQALTGASLEIRTDFQSRLNDLKEFYRQALPAAGQELWEYTKQYAPYAPVGGAAGQVGKTLPRIGKVTREVTDWLRNIGNLVPQFAAGGVVSGPTLAMVGEYVGAGSNPEVIAPLSDLQSMIGTDEQVAVLRQILQAVREGQSVTVTISEDEVTQAVIRGHNKRARRLGKSELIL